MNFSPIYICIITFSPSDIQAEKPSTWATDLFSLRHKSIASSLLPELREDQRPKVTGRSQQGILRLCTKGTKCPLPLSACVQIISVPYKLTFLQRLSKFYRRSGCLWMFPGAFRKALATDAKWKILDENHSCPILSTIPTYTRTKILKMTGGNPRSSIDDGLADFRNWTEWSPCT